jgi:hypothetical protein
MFRYYMLDERGEPVGTDDIYVWAAWFEDVNNRILAHDRDESGTRDVMVSTVFLALDHSFGLGPPVLWETMVFVGGGGRDVYCERYTSRADALAGHRRACKMANRGEFDDR